LGARGLDRVFGLQNLSSTSSRGGGVFNQGVRRSPRVTGSVYKLDKKKFSLKNAGFMDSKYKLDKKKAPFNQTQVSSNSIYKLDKKKLAATKPTKPIAILDSSSDTSVEESSTEKILSQEPPAKKPRLSA
jgi:hypothetical protein